MNAATYSACYRSASRRLRRLTNDPQLIDSLSHDTIVSVWAKSTDTTDPAALPRLAYRRAFWLFREYIAQLGRDQHKVALSSGLDSVADTTAPEPMPELATTPQAIVDLVDSSDDRLSDMALLLAFFPDSSLQIESAAQSIGLSPATGYRLRLKLQHQLAQSQVAYTICRALAECID
jgi:DNA-directed RNA polymerase specialized sigma24 family protein